MTEEPATPDLPCRVTHTAEHTLGADGQIPPSPPGGRFLLAFPALSRGLSPLRPSLSTPCPVEPGQAVCCQKRYQPTPHPQRPEKKDEAERSCSRTGVHPRGRLTRALRPVSSLSSAPAPACAHERRGLRLIQSLLCTKNASQVSACLVFADEGGGLGRMLQVTGWPAAAWRDSEGRLRGTEKTRRRANSPHGISPRGVSAESVNVDVLKD